MPLAPLFADRLKGFGTMPRSEFMKAFEAPVGTYESPDLEVSELSAGSVPVITYRPKNVDQDLPVLIWMHGGGFQFGNYKMNEGDIVSREMAHRANIMVVNVEYRLVTETLKFPAPHDDVTEVLDWVVANLSELGARRDAIFIGGISAGASLAATAAVIDRDRGTNYIKGQLLNCPLLHRIVPEPNAELASKLEELNGFYISRELSLELNTFVVKHGDEANAKPEWRAGDIADHAGLAMAQIINCEYDTLRASGEKYAEQLKAAGVDVEVLTQAGVPHAHINRYPGDCEQVGETLDNMARYVKANS